MVSQDKMESQPPVSPPSSSADSQPKNDSPVPAADDRFGRLNWILFASGVLMMVLGYVLLAMAGRDAAGAAGHAAPLAIVGGMIVFGLGFFPRAPSRQ